MIIVELYNLSFVYAFFRNRQQSHLCFFDTIRIINHHMDKWAERQSKYAKWSYNATLESRFIMFLCIINILFRVWRRNQFAID